MNYKLESDLEADVVEWATSEGGYSVKLKIENERGWADQTIFLPDRRIIIPELKRPKKNKRSFNQEKWIARLSRLGFPTGFCESLDDVKELLKSYE